MVSEWRSVIAVSPNVGGSVRLIKPAKLYMCTQTHYKHGEDGRTAPGVRGHGSVPLSHSGNVVTRIGLHTHILQIHIRVLWQLLLLLSYSKVTADNAAISILIILESNFMKDSSSKYLCGSIKVPLESGRWYLKVTQ